MSTKNSLNSSIGSRIQLIRKKSSLTQMAFAEMIGVSTQYISDLERGVVGASVSTIVKISDTLNVPTDYILRGIDPATEKPIDLFLAISKYNTDQQKLILDAIKNFQSAFSYSKEFPTSVVTLPFHPDTTCLSENIL